MFLTFLGENGRVKWNRIYSIMLNTVFNLLQIPKIEIYFANAIMMANAFMYLPKSEATVHTCSSKNLF